MSSFTVSVTQEQIDDFPDVRRHWDDPVAKALEELTGVAVDIDGDDNGYIATIGTTSGSTLVVDLPPAAAAWLNARWSSADEAPGEPFTFEIEIPEWIARLVKP